MPRPADEMDDLRRMCPGAQEMPEGGIEYILLPGLKHPCAPGTLDALLCPQQHGGYATRLFLSVAIPGKGNNWSAHTILNFGPPVGDLTDPQFGQSTQMLLRREPRFRL